MTREKILRDRLEMAAHNLHCYSSNWDCSEPKEGCEGQHQEAAEEVKMLETWLKEFHSTRTDSTVEYIGHLNTVAHGSTYDSKPLATKIEFEVDTGASYLYGDRRIFHVAAEAQHWFIGEGGFFCGKYDAEKDHRDSLELRIVVDRSNYVRSIEWAVNEEAE